MNVRCDIFSEVNSYLTVILRPPKEFLSRITRWQTHISGVVTRI